MTTYKALFLDIDGTILKPDHTYDDSTKEAIRQVQEQGIEVFLATGRPLHEIIELADELGVHSFIGYNGALAIHNGQIIVNETVHPSTVRSFINIAKKHGHEVALYTGDKSFFTTFNDSLVQTFINTLGFKKNHLFDEQYIEDILSITLINVRNEELPLYEINPHYRFSIVNVDGLRSCHDLIQKSVNKGQAIQEIARVLDMKSEEAIAFGDAMNDKEMLQFVGEGFAMGNALPDLLPYAKHQTSDVTDSGIFNGLKKLGLVT